MAAMSLRLPEELETRLDEEARAAGVARSEIVRTAVAEFLDRKERERYLAAFIAEARAAYADPTITRESVTLAEEALPLDDEGLRAVEQRDDRAARPNNRGRRGS